VSFEWLYYICYGYGPTLLNATLLAFAVVFISWLLGRLGRPHAAPSEDPPAPAYRFHFSLQGLVLFVMGLAGSAAVFAQGGAYQPFGVVVLGGVFVVALLRLHGR
jgi:hypothetical protein